MNKRAALIGAPRAFRDLSVAHGPFSNGPFPSLEAKRRAGQRDVSVWEIKPRNLRALCSPSLPLPPFPALAPVGKAVRAFPFSSAPANNPPAFLFKTAGVSRGNFFHRVSRRQMTARRAAKFNCVYRSVNWRGIFAGYRYDTNQNVILLTHCAPICTPKRPGNAEPSPITRKKYLTLYIERFSHFFRNAFFNASIQTRKRYFSCQRFSK